MATSLNTSTLRQTARVGAHRVHVPQSSDLEVPARTRLRITHRGQVALVVLVTLVLAIVMSVFVMGTAGASASVQSVSAEPAYISVQAGETLWQLAEKLDPNADPRDLIAEIVALNDLPSSTVEAGQRLALPVRFS